MPKKKIILASIIILVFTATFLLNFNPLQAKPRPKITRYSPGSFEGEQAEVNFQVRAILTSPVAIERDRSIALADISDPPTTIEWEIFKPNVYAAEVFGLLFSYEFPSQIQISFDGVENLTPLEGEVSPIDISYAVSEQELSEEQVPFDPEYVIEGEEDIAEVTREHSLTWLTPDEMNNSPIFLSPDQSTSTRLNIWTKIRIDFDTRSCNYTDRDGFYITVTAIPF